MHIAIFLGLLTLFQAYQFDLQNTIQNGTLQYFDHLENEKIYFAYERMTIYDYEELMNLAIEKQLYSVAIHILKGMLTIQQVKQSEDPKLLERLEMARKKLIKWNNGYLAKSERFLCKYTYCH